MVNAKGTQDLFVYALTRNGRVETTNYRTVKLPSDMELPVFLKQPNEFSGFYKAMFARQVDNESGRAVFVEYAWDMRWCDPCAADPLTGDELRSLGVFWNDGDRGMAPNVFLTRLHVRYDNAHFPEDLVFQETAERSTSRGRNTPRPGGRGNDSSAGAPASPAEARNRHEQEATRVASLTGWNVGDVRRRAGLGDQPLPEAAWWERL